MVEKELKTRIQLRYDNLTNWLNTSVVGQGGNLVLRAGEVAICYVPTETSGMTTTAPTALMKVGDGTHAFKDLPWSAAKAADVYEWAKAANKPTYTASEITGLSEAIAAADKLFVFNVNTTTLTCDKTKDDLMAAYKAGKQFVAIVNGICPTFNQSVFYNEDPEAVQLWFYNIESYDNQQIVEELGVYFGDDASAASGIDIDYSEYEQNLILSINNVEPEYGGALTLTQDNIPDGTNYKQYSAADKAKLAGLNLFIIPVTRTYNTSTKKYDYSTTVTVAEINAAYEANKVLIAHVPTTSCTGAPTGSQPSTLNLMLTEAEAYGQGYIMSFGALVSYQPGNITTQHLAEYHLEIVAPDTGSALAVSFHSREIYANLSLLEAIPEDAAWETNMLITEESLKTKYVTAGQLEGSTLGEHATAEGFNTTASDFCSHAEGESTVASGMYAHVEGIDSQATGFASHAEGQDTRANGYASHAEGYRTVASDREYPQHVSGSMNIADTTSAVIVGNGNDDEEDVFSNAFTLGYNGEGWFAGDVYTGSTSGTHKDAGSVKLATETITNNLSERITNLEARGRFLSSWNASTGLPTTYPTIPSGAAYPYTYNYKAGDYYIVSAIGSTNSRPSGSGITKASASASWTVTSVTESAEVAVGDYYLYDGTNWILIENTTKTITSSQISDKTITYTSENKNSETATSNKAITQAIAGLEATVSNLDTGKTIATITELDGVMSATFQDINIISSQISDKTTTYTSDNKSSTTATSNAAITAALETLDVSDISGFGAGKTLASLSETDGKIAATFQDISITKSQVSDFAHTHNQADIVQGDDDVLVFNCGSSTTII